MPLLELPNELLLHISRSLLHCPTCHCHHISQNLSSLSRCNHSLHNLLAEQLLATASKQHMLSWAIANGRPDTVAIALERGADPNTRVRPNQLDPLLDSRPTDTPVGDAIRMRAQSPDVESHALKLTTLALLLAAGGTCTLSSLVKPNSYGDLDLLTLCLPRLRTPDRNSHSGPQAILGIAASYGHVEATRLAVQAGAAVNYTGTNGGVEYYPPLWVFWESPIAVLQVLLNAGADPNWHARNGTSVVHHMRQRSGDMPEVEAKVALLVRYGAIDGPALSPAVGVKRRQAKRHQYREYRGWMPGSSEPQVDWAEDWARAGGDGGCGCEICPVEVTGGIVSGAKK